jgi:hypothetical protein
MMPASRCQTGPLNKEDVRAGRAPTRPSVRQLARPLRAGNVVALPAGASLPGARDGCKRSGAMLFARPRRPVSTPVSVITFATASLCPSSCSFAFTGATRELPSILTAARGDKVSHYLDFAMNSPMIRRYGEQRGSAP